MVCRVVQLSTLHLIFLLLFTDLQTDMQSASNGLQRSVRVLQVYLEGELERGIVPLESAWMHGRGIGEDGCLLMLQKMNLEVLQK